MIRSINFYLCIFMEFVDNKKNSDFFKDCSFKIQPLSGSFFMEVIKPSREYFYQPKAANIH